jgi:hypothetical protein
MALTRALVSGAAGALALNALHETARRMIPHAPRMDVIGMRALAQALRGADQDVPPEDELFTWTLVGDLISNALYYSLVGLGSKDGIWFRGAALGAAAGVGGALLPPKLGLGHQPDEETPATQAMTVAWYLVGGLAAAAVASRLARR